MRQRRAATLALTATMLAIGLFAAPAARAGSTIVVDVQGSALGGAGCTLTEAILAANQDASTVRFDAGPPSPVTYIDTGCTAGDGDDVIEVESGQYVYTQPFSDPDSHLGPAALPMIKSRITIEGRGAVLRRSSAATVDFRLFSVGPDGDLDLREVEVQGFTAHGGRGSDGGGGGMGAGGAIFVHDGALRVQWSTFASNTATGGDGGRISSPGGGGGGGGGIGGNGAYGSLGGGGGGGARGDASAALAHNGGGGGGTLLDGGFVGVSDPNVGGYRCGGGGNDFDSGGDADGYEAYCDGGGGGGGSDSVIQTGDGGAGRFGGGGGGGALCGSVFCGDGGGAGFGGGGGAAGTDSGGDGGGGGDAGFGAGGGAGPDDPGSGGTFGGNASDLAGGGGAGLGGAIFAYRANVIISNSTFTGNVAVRGVGGDGARNGADAGGAIFAVGGSTSIVNTTISGNESTGDGAGLTVYKPTTGEGASLSLSNTIIYGNSGRDECFLRNGVSASGARNLIAVHDEDAQTPCPAIYLHDDPRLGPLTLNAPGKTPTMALAATSPAIDEALDTAAPLDDQRGVLRPQGDYPDIGAFELEVPTDVTAPVAAPTTAPAANGAGWNRTAVTVTWHWADEAGGSGIDPSACTATSTSSTQGAGIVLSATCDDLAGNMGSASATVNVDQTAPTAAPSTAPAANGNGWNRTDVTVTWGWSDTGGSGIDPGACPATSTSSGEGATIVVGGTCEDVADNVGSASTTVRVDKTAPDVTCGTAPSFTLSGDHTTNVTATVSDGLSGPVASAIAAPVSATDVATVGAKVKPLTGQDRAGNQRTVECPYLVKYAFLGFQSPLPKSAVKAGSSVPVKFRLGSASGATLPDATAAGLATSCLVQVTLDGVVQGCASYDAKTDTFGFDIKTPKALTPGVHRAGIRVRATDGSVVNTDDIVFTSKK